MEYFETTDLVTMHTHALMTYGDVRRAAGDVTAAEAAYRKALDLSRRKGSIVEAGMVETRLASLRPPRNSGRGPV